MDIRSRLPPCSSVERQKYWYTRFCNLSPLCVLGLGVTGFPVYFCQGLPGKRSTHFETTSFQFLSLPYSYAMFPSETPKFLKAMNTSLHSALTLPEYLLSRRNAWMLSRLGSVVKLVCVAERGELDFIMQFRPVVRHSKQLCLHCICMRNSAIWGQLETCNGLCVIRLYQVNNCLLSTKAE